MRLKSFILTIGLSLFALSGLLAQEKYEYATIIEQGPAVGGKFIVISQSLSNGEYKDIQLENPTGKAPSYMNHAIVLKYIATMSKDGWEVISYNGLGTGTIFTCMLKRKTNNQ
ncbi:MAG TPA: hypothetical protein VK174_18295 [Chitinophagales bacterium]|nr:hypothetical protein [Chitinophagales bacterium]